VKESWQASAAQAQAYPIQMDDTAAQPRANVASKIRSVKVAAGFAKSEPDNPGRVIGQPMTPATLHGGPRG
jgi:hypothetical protein